VKLEKEKEAKKREGEGESISYKFIPSKLASIGVQIMLK